MGRWRKRMRQKRKAMLRCTAVALALMLGIPGNLGMVHAQETGAGVLLAEQAEEGESKLALTKAKVKFWESGVSYVPDMVSKLENRKISPLLKYNKQATGGKRISFEFEEPITFSKIALTSYKKGGLPRNIIFRYPRNDTIKDENLKDGELNKIDGMDWDVALDYKGTEGEDAGSYSHEYTLDAGRLGGKTELTTKCLILQFEAPVPENDFGLFGITFGTDSDDGGASVPLNPEEGGGDNPDPDNPDKPDPDNPDKPDPDNPDKPDPDNPDKPDPDNPDKPVIPTGEALEVAVSAEKAANGVKLLWTAVEGAYGYNIWKAGSAYPKAENITKVGDTYYPEDGAGLEFTDAEGGLSDYYWITALKGAQEETGLSKEAASLEKEMFGDHTIIFSPQDDVSKIDALLGELFEKNGGEQAQFHGEQWQVYFKPGDYTETKCIDVGFYTSVSGLGKTPYEVRLNNIAVPPCLSDNNATCSFWRSIENFSVIDTRNEAGKVGHGSWSADKLNWSVAQAAPMRRIYSTRGVTYDWNFGWASGGYTADCKFAARNGDNGNNEIGKVGTWSGQQYYTRNSEMQESVGTTLNNFNQGVIAENLPNEETGEALQGGNGYSNWGIPGNNNDQQVLTSVETTPKLAEKPFLYLEGSEYKVFVPAVRTDTKGVSWDENSMGEGQSIPLSEFYIAKPSDTAAVINGQLEAGKNIFFTPGTYHAEEAIRVTHSNTVVLGSGMMSIVADNSEAAMVVSDEADHVRIAGIIFDAGRKSDALLVVGDKKEKSHADAPTILQDIFCRIGGATSKARRADQALVINSNDVIGDHFWLWRADHGEGVTWRDCQAENGLVVNGDHVTCYALFNEHFQGYDTLWNGDDGATYFYQNEKCYDPESQEGWMSHDGTANGFAAYKVSEGVKKHYAVGFGIYNVFIYTGPNRDATVSICLDNGMEVPNSPDVLVENACMQTFAKDDGVYQTIDHIINGVGLDVNSGSGGHGWNRTFVLNYCNGTATVGTTRGKAGTEVVTGIPEIKTTDRTELKAAIAKAQGLEESDYTEDSWMDLQDVIKEVKNAKTQEEVDKVTADLNAAIGNLVPKPVDRKALDDAIREASAFEESDYTAKSWEKLQKALEDANRAKTQSEVNKATDSLKEAIDRLVSKPVDIKPLEEAIAELSKRVNELKTALDDKSQEKAIAELAKRVEELKSSVEDKSLQEAVTALSKDINDLKVAVDNKQQEESITELGKRISELKAMLESRLPKKSPTAAWVGGNKVKVAWGKAPNATRYMVYRSYKKDSGYQKIATTKKLSYTDAKAKAGKTVYYKLAYYNGKTKIADSKVISSYVLAAPAKVKAKAGKKAATVSFQKVSKASGYRIYLAKAKNGKYKKAAVLFGAKNVKKTFKKLKKGTYYYKVKACRKVGGKTYYSNYSKTAMVRVK